jgi:NHLM bacteriocin system ABC transporter ATP-binding protein
MTVQQHQTKVRAAEDGVAWLGGLGEPVSLTSSRTLPLDDADSFWLIEDGAVDLFAVGEGARGRWHFLARLQKGMLVLGSIPGPLHTLVCRPLPGGKVRRIGRAELIDIQREVWVPRRQGDPLSWPERAFLASVEAGVEALAHGVRNELPPRDFVPIDADRGVELTQGQRARSVDGLLWAQVVQGRIVIGGVRAFRVRDYGDQVVLGEDDWIECDSRAIVRARRTADLLIDGTLWHRLLENQARFLYTVDRCIELSDKVDTEELAAGHAAGAAAFDRALRQLGESIDPKPGEPVPDDDEDDDTAAFAVARLVARASGFRVKRAGQPETLDSKLDPIEQVALASRFRTRPLRLENNWWHTNIGALIGYRRDNHAPVALLWRRTGYVMTDTGHGLRPRVTAAIAETLEVDALMFYRPLPDKPVTGIRLLLFGLRGSRGDTTRLVLGGMAAVLLGLLVPIASGQVLGKLVPNAQRDLIIQMCIALILTGVVAAAFSILENLAVLRMEGRFEATLQAAVWDRLLRLPTAFFSRYSTGQLSSAALGISALREVLSGVSATAAHALLLGLVNFTLLFFFSVPLALVAGALVAIAAIFCLGVGLVQVRWQRRLVDLNHNLSSKVFLILTGLPKLRVAGGENFAYGVWAGDFAKGRRLSWVTRRMQNAVTVFHSGYPVLCTLILFALLTGPAQHSLSVSAFLSFNAAFGILMAATVQFTSAVTSAVGIVPMFERVTPVTRELPEVSEQQAMPPDLSGEIELSQVSFSYSPEAPTILDEVSFQIRPGEFTAIVGPTGCGKSTLLRLLVGFEKPSNGSVLYDGQDLAMMDVTAVRRQCGVVLQNGQLFAGSIMSNICGIGTYTLDDAWAAAEMAGLDEDIAHMPMGMHTVISDGARTISAGQRQRLMIARALVGRPRIIFFDEATSALDNETQAIVTESTRKLNATRVVIAHRLSTIMQADRVIVLDRGRIAQIGAPSELLADQDGMFHQLLRRQIA